MSLHGIALRVLFAYVFLLVIMRVSGKRTVRQVTPIDMTASLIIGDLLDDLIWAEVPAAQSVVAVGTLMVLAMSVTLGTASFPAFKRLIEGKPVELVRNGGLVPEGLKRENVTEAELMALLREQEIDDIREVETAYLESDGQLGVCRHKWAKDAQRQDLVRVRQAA